MPKIKPLQLERSKHISEIFLSTLHNVLNIHKIYIFISMVLISIQLSCVFAHAQNVNPLQLKAKADKAVALFKKRVTEGKDVSKILPYMERVKALGDAGQFDEADALLDEIIPQLQTEQTSSPAKNANPLLTAIASAPRMTEIMMAGAPDHGIFDPSIALDGTGGIYMSLSGVTSTTPGGNFATIGVRTYLAVSGDQGKNWKLLGVLNPDIGVTLGKAPTNGRWQSEVSALIYDAQAPKQARWKIVWHQYLNINGERKFEHGWIAYKEAETPGALAKARPVKLFTAAAYDAINDNSVGWTRSPIAEAAANKVQHLAPALQDCIAVSEPGFMAKPNALYMSLVCFKSGLMGISSDVVMLKCPRPCNAAAPGAWSYAGTIFTPTDSQALKVGKFSASDLFSDNGKDYITVSPEGSTPVADAYKGCNVFRFADIASGKVERDAFGRPFAVKTLSVNKESFNGACSFLPTGMYKGLLIGRIDFVKTLSGVDATFHVLRSNVSP